jgi:hypothetical protein
VEEAISEEVFMVLLTTESPSTQCEDLEPSNEEPEGGIMSVLDLDAGSLCGSLVEWQEILDQHGASDAAECIEKGRNLKIKLLSKLDRQLWIRS